MNHKIMKKIERIGKQHMQEYSQKYDLQGLRTDWYEGLKFFFDHSFYRGRQDSTSEKIEKRAIGLLDGVFLNKNNLLIAPPISEYLEFNGINHHGDRDMILGSLGFVKELDDRNILNYSINKIESGEEKELFRHLKSISWVGDKISSFFIRDVVGYYNLDINNYSVAYPVDTWVQNVSGKLGLVHEKDKLKQVKKKSIGYLLNGGISPIHFNQGLWVVGTNSLDFLLEEWKKE